MPAVRDRIIQQDFSEGMNRDVAPALIPKAGAYDLVDALLNEDGNPYRRGGTAYKSSAGLGEAGLTWGWDGYLSPGQRTLCASDSTFGVLGEDDEEMIDVGGAGLAVPRQASVLADLLFIGGGSIYGGSRKSATYSTGTVKVTKGSKTVEGTGTSWSANVDEGMLFHISGERVYVVDSVDSNTKLTLRDDYEGSSGEGKSYALRPLHTIGGTDPYEDSNFYASCANRIVVLNGRTIKFTGVNDPHTYKNSFGKSNEHKLPMGVEGVGLATIGQTLLIFTTAGVWALDGLALEIVDVNGNNQHRLQLLSSDLILAGAAGIAGSGQQLVIPAADGIYLMDGVSSPMRISKPIEQLYGGHINNAYLLGGAAVYRGHYFLPILYGSEGVRDCLVCRLDRPIRSRKQTGYPWSRFTGDGGEIRCFFVRSSTDPRQPELYGAQAREPSRIVDCSHYFKPEVGREMDADGTTHDFDLITRDIETGELTKNVIRAVKLRYDLVEGNGGEPLLKVYWSDGSLEAGGAAWDEVLWDEFEWAAGGDGAVFTEVTKDGPPSDGRDPEKFPVNKRLRYGRFRIMTSGAPAQFALRLLEMDVRPSGAVRR